MASPEAGTHPTPPVLERSGPTPLHVQIADHFRRQIYGMFWPPNFQLASEAHLAEQLGVARGTIRRALQVLIAEGILTQAHGRGTFVADVGGMHDSQRSPVFSGTIISNGEQLERAGIEYHDSLLEYTINHTNASDHGNATAFDASDLLHFERLRSLREGPNSIISTDVMLSLIPGIASVEPAELVQGSFHTLLRKRFSISFSYAERVYSAQAADEKMAELLNVPQGTPLLVHDQYSYDSLSRCVERSRAWTRTDRHLQTIILKGFS